MKKFILVLLVMSSLCQVAFAAHQYRVVFYNGKDIISEQYITEGKSAESPKNPAKEGKTFEKWDTDFSKIETDTVITAVYKEDNVDANSSVAEDYTKSTKENSKQLLDTDKPSNAKISDNIEKSNTESNSDVKDDKSSDNKDKVQIKSNYVKNPDTKIKNDMQTEKDINTDNQVNRNSKIILYIIVLSILGICTIIFAYYILKVR